MSTEKKASKVLQLCKKYQLKESSKSRVSLWLLFFIYYFFFLVVADLCKVMAMNCYRNGRIGAALSWCIKGKASFGVGNRFFFFVVVVVHTSLMSHQWHCRVSTRVLLMLHGIMFVYVCIVRMLL